MARDRTARARVRQLLATGGPISDSSGFATSVLKERIDYKGTGVAFIQLIAAMEAEGEITREIRGKRTYKISATSATRDAYRPVAVTEAADSGQATPSSVVAPVVSIDYEKLAKTMVQELWSVFAAVASATANVQSPVESTHSEAAVDDDVYARRIEAARNALDELFNDVESRSKAAASKV